MSIYRWPASSSRMTPLVTILMILAGLTVAFGFCVVVGPRVYALWTLLSGHSDRPENL
jgi:hypothetical protein